MSRETHTEETKEGWLYRPDLSVRCTTVSVPVCPSHADSNPHLLSLNLPFTSFSFCPGVQYPRGLIYRAVSDLCRQEGGMKLPSFASRSAACSCTSINRRMRPIVRSRSFDKSNWSFAEKKGKKRGRRREILICVNNAEDMTKKSRSGPREKVLSTWLYIN